MAMPEKKIILPLIFITSFFSRIDLFSQTKQIDSLRAILVNAKEDTNMVNLLDNLSYQIYQSKGYENSLLFARQQLLLAKKLSYAKGEARALINIGNNKVDQNRLAEAREYYEAALVICKQIKYEKYIGVVYADFGNIESLRGNYSMALNYFDTALIYYRKIGDKMHIAHTMANMGMNYYDQNNYAEAANHLYMAVNYFEEIGNATILGDCHYYIGNIKAEQKNYADALIEYTKSVQINTALYKGSNEPSGYMGAAALSTCRIGEVYLATGNSDEALAKFNAALEKLRDTKLTEPVIGGKSMCYTGIGQVLELRGDSLKIAGDTQMARYNFLLAYENFTKALNQNIKEGYGKRNYENDMPKIYNLLGSINIKLNNYPQAVKWIKQGLTLAIEKKARPQIRDSYFNLADFYEHTGNISEAYYNYKKYALYRDSIVNEESVRKTEGFKMEYEFKKKEDSLKTVQFVTETKLQAQRNQKYFSWLAVVSLALLTFLGYRNFQNQKKINRLAKETYDAEKVELELQSLKAQMNPHFMFNCINSIDAFIQSNDKYNATLYLNKFAKLIRNVLDSSKQNLVLFSKDIDTLKLYIELEELRHENKFSTWLDIDPELLINDYKVPPLIIQPFVENAILHGLKNRPGNEGRLIVMAKRTGDDIQYTVTDNGIGRTAAASIGQNKESSYGMELSSDRVKLFNREKEASVYIEDLYKNEKAAGTSIRVILKNV